MSQNQITLQEVKLYDCFARAGASPVENEKYLKSAMNMVGLSPYGIEMKEQDTWAHEGEPVKYIILPRDERSGEEQEIFLGNLELFLASPDTRKDQKLDPNAKETTVRVSFDLAATGIISNIVISKGNLNLTVEGQTSVDYSKQFSPPRFVSR